MSVFKPVLFQLYLGLEHSLTSQQFMHLFILCVMFFPKSVFQLDFLIVPDYRQAASAVNRLLITNIAYQGIFR